MKDGVRPSSHHMVHATLYRMSTPKKIGIVVAVLLIGAMSYYAISPLFRNIKADDPLPGAVEEPSETATTSETGRPETMREIGADPVPVMGTFGHPASGTVRIVEADGRRYVRYENYKTINGPDIFVYLATGPDAKDFINLGRVKATEGNINYEIPPDADLSNYRYVLTWCRMFSVLFNSAELPAT